MKWFRRPMPKPAGVEMPLAARIGFHWMMTTALLAGKEATGLKIILHGCSVGDELLGDWEFTVQRIAPPVEIAHG
jgi:hypothetical protein